MKKMFFTLLLLITIFGSDGTNVYALEYEQWDLIPIDTVATVETENFLYKDFYYNSSTDVNGYTSIDFSSVKNLSNDKLPISISVGLFDSKKENIGVINYCSLSDKSSSYSDMKIDANSDSIFSLKIKPGKYNSTDSNLSDVTYITIMSDNKYCKTGGATNFVGLDINQMKDGATNKQIQFNESTKQKQGVIKVFIVVLVIGIIYMLFGSVVSSLYMRMYNRWSTMSYVPIINNYLSFKMSFGPLVGIILTLLVGLFFVIGLLGVKIFMYIGVVFVGLSFIVNIIKILTNNYEFLYFASDKIVDVNNNYYVNNNIDNSSKAYIFKEENLEEETEFNDSTTTNRYIPAEDTESIMNNSVDNSTNDYLNDIVVDEDDKNDEVDMKVFDINLNEQVNNSYSDDEAEYFDMENSDTLSQFDNNFNISEGSSSQRTIPINIADDIILNNTMDEEDNNDEDEDADLTTFF